ncbi:hypothetical protein B0T21DRAFT_346179 [Apiosordaria backusii]|uniref:Uncharacterized protein n=1 Tax=Apiosordaria backusii TaxID=314023 RepID=A0AA40EN38_9PEZI|nr:hypothetical protein B0T21DRAFT_346179 [Apiosordaria backusii]
MTTKTAESEPLMATLSPELSSPPSPVGVGPPPPPPINTRPGSGLNPRMVYRPITPPDAHFPLSSSSADDGNDKRWKIGIPLLTILRLALIALIIADIAVWIAHDHFLFHALTFGHVWLWIILLWNLGHVVSPLLSKISGGRSLKGIPGLPTIVCQVGDCACVLNGDNDDNDDDDHHHHHHDHAKKKRSKYGISWILDILLGIVPIVVASTTIYMYYRHMIEILVLTDVVGILSIVIGIFSLFTASRPVIFEMGLVIKSNNDDEGERGQYRIRLPVDENDRRTAGGTVSVSA